MDYLRLFMSLDKHVYFLNNIMTMISVTEKIFVINVVVVFFFVSLWFAVPCYLIECFRVYSSLTKTKHKRWHILIR